MFKSSYNNWILLISGAVIDLGTDKLIQLFNSNCNEFIAVWKFVFSLGLISVNPNFVARSINGLDSSITKAKSVPRIIESATLIVNVLNALLIFNPNAIIDSANPDIDSPM